MLNNKKDLDDSKLFSDELIDIIENKEKQNSDSLYPLIKRLIDGEPKNINPLTEIPEPQMRLYGFDGTFNSAYFDKEEELIEYIKTHSTQFGSVIVMDYLGNVAGCSDVIRLTYKSGNHVLYTSVDQDGYGKYNHERSIYRGEFVWEYCHGSIRDMYSAFRDRGIVFEDDTYAKIDEMRNRYLSICEEVCEEVFGNSRKRTKQD